MIHFFAWNIDEIVVTHKFCMSVDDKTYYWCRDRLTTQLVHPVIIGIPAGGIIKLVIRTLTNAGINVLGNFL